MLKAKIGLVYILKNTKRNQSRQDKQDSLFFAFFKDKTNSSIAERTSILRAFLIKFLAYFMQIQSKPISFQAIFGFLSLHKRETTAAPVCCLTNLHLFSFLFS